MNQIYLGWFLQNHLCLQAWKRNCERNAGTYRLVSDRPQEGRRSVIAHRDIHRPIAFLGAHTRVEYIICVWISSLDGFTQ